MVESVLIKNVEIVSEKGVVTGDVFFENNVITDIAPSISKHAELEINDSGLTLLPGVIDPHVHFREPGSEQKETLYTGSKAAASGGVTTFFDMPNTSPATVTLKALEAKKMLAAQTSLINYNFFVGATTNNLDVLKQVENIPGIKIYVGSSTGTLLVDQDEPLEAIFRDTKHIIAVHSEDEKMIQEKQLEYAGSSNVLDHEKIRSAEGALKCTQRLIALAKKYQHRLHICHLTTKQEVALLRNLSSRGLITSEVTPQHMFTYAPDIYEKWGTKAQINPPIRHRDHQEVLFKALQEGVIDCMASDHAPHLEEEKNQSFPHAPSGMPGVETSLPLMLDAVHNGHFSIEQLVNVMSKTPASIYNIQKRGALTVGHYADAVLVDRHGTHTITKDNVYTKSGWSIFEGQSLKGKIVATFVNGSPVFREGDFFEDKKGMEVAF